MARYVMDLEEIDRTQVTVVGGKGANLGELSRMEGIRVPAGFCITTDAFERIVARMREEAPSIGARLDELGRLAPDDRETIAAISAELRRTLEAIVIPDDLAAAITHSLARLGERSPYAVRSSATAEDLPTTSFAGQHDTYLNVMGGESILRHVSRCWASLFTERAVTYRLRNGVDHRKVHMAVVVQRMVSPQAAGTLFTADPITGHRKVASIEASFALGEALVCGLVNPDIYQVRDDAIIARTIVAKRVAVQAAPSGGTQRTAIEPAMQELPALTDAQVIRLARLGRRIEKHFGSPQDIEWCLAGDEFHVVQTRAITTLFPIPAAGDGENRVYVSVGHQQMMTDPMKPLGLSFWQMTTPRPMAESGGRLFVDVTRALASPGSRAGLLEALARSDPLIGDALRSIVDRGDFIQPLPDDEAAPPPGGAPSAATPAPIATDPVVVTRLIESAQASIATVKRDIRMKSGTELLDFIQSDLQELKRILFDPTSHQAIMAGMEATWWLNDQLQAWLGERNAADTLAQSVPHNVTTEMGLSLLDVADVIRLYPEVVAFLQQVEDDDFLDQLPRFAGGRQARDAIQTWLDEYGMRGVGEIDITRPRWNERPSSLLPLLLGNIRRFESGVAARRYEEGRERAWKKEEELLERLRALPGGEEKAHEAKRMIGRLRTFIGYREFPKYGMVSRYYLYKQALMREAERLVQDGVLREKEDIYFLRFEELREVVRTKRADERLLRERKEAFKTYGALTPPRVLTSDGEGVTGSYRRDDLPAGALVGLPVSAGTVEGRARVILDMTKADLEEGDVLVTAFTDPSWTPLFIAIAGLVTEVGGSMTHGAVIAREYGVPAVVGVQNATRLIRDGARIRLHGTEGYVEVLS